MTTPWKGPLRVEREDVMDVEALVVDDAGYVVADCSILGRTERECEAIASYLVRAANAHDGTKDALREIATLLHQVPVTQRAGDYVDDALSVVAAALARAEGEGA